MNTSSTIRNTMTNLEEKTTEHHLSCYFRAATSHASSAMNRWTNGQIHLSLDRICESRLEDAITELDLGFELYTMVVIDIRGSEGGQIVLAFDEANGRRLAANLLGRALSASAEMSSLERSALMETGNILASAYLAELSRLTECELIPSAPVLVQDFGASAIEQLLMLQAESVERVLVCKTKFDFCKQEVQWLVFVLPGNNLLDALSKSSLASNSSGLTSLVAQ